MGENVYHVMHYLLAHAKNGPQRNEIKCPSFIDFNPCVLLCDHIGGIRTNEFVNGKVHLAFSVTILHDDGVTLRVFGSFLPAGCLKISMVCLGVQLVVSLLIYLLVKCVCYVDKGFAFPDQLMTFCLVMLQCNCIALMSVTFSRGTWGCGYQTTLRNFYVRQSGVLLSHVTGSLNE